MCPDGQFVFGGTQQKSIRFTDRVRIAHGSSRKQRRVSGSTKRAAAGELGMQAAHRRFSLRRISEDHCPRPTRLFQRIELAGASGLGCTWQTRSLAVKIDHDDGQAGHDAKRELMLLKHLNQSHRSTFVCHLRAWRKKGGQYLLLFK